MKSFFTILIFSAICFAQFDTNSFQSIKQTVSSDEIKAMGIINLSDLYSLADKWNSFSIDGFNQNLSANNLSTYQRQNFILVVDGQKIDLNTFDIQNINLLPVSIYDIESVEFINLQGIYEGEYTSSGLIHIHTKKPEEKLTAHTNLSLGNETGDPGPYKFTSLKTQNVDKLNYNLGLTLNYGSRNWFIKGNIKSEDNYVTDAALRDRINYFHPGNNKARLISVSGTVQIKNDFSTSRIFAFKTDEDDFNFFAIFGNELPVKRSIRHFGVNGELQFNQQLAINYRLQYSDNDLNNRENPAGYVFTLHKNNIKANAELNYSTPIFNSVIGVSFNRYNFQTERKLEDNILSFRNIYTAISFNSTKNVFHSFQFFANRLSDDFTYKGTLINNWAVSKNQKAALHFSFSQNSVEEDLNYWTLFKRGYLFNPVENTEHFISAGFNTSRTFTGDIIYKYSKDSLFSVEIDGSLRRFENIYLENFSYQYNAVTSTFTTPIELRTGNSLTSAGGSALIEFNQAAGIKHRLFYQYQKSVAGDDLFEKIRRAIPEHQFNYRFIYTPMETFSVSLLAKYKSKIIFEEYKYLADQSNGKLSGTIKPGITFDISLQKWFWSKKIWTNVIFKNIFNQQEKYYPAGIDYNLRFYVQVFIYLDKLPE
ncbi:MAG: Plug domain-containing protein [Ignavibacteriales bacterium]|nr:MAG: Plug domain-containing protein [Ignavibacteriales bacterium]